MRRVFALSACLAVFACTGKDNPVGVDLSVEPVNLIAGESELEVGGLPETFRVERRSRTEERPLSSAGFEAPFTLHLENGDERGRNRVTRARVMTTKTMRTMRTTTG